jgi:uncharacterized protein YodC (DUF2158 family)
MTVNVGDIVKFKDSGSKGEIGRVCKDNGISVCVQFKSSSNARRAAESAPDGSFRTAGRSRPSPP